MNAKRKGDSSAKGNITQWKGKELPSHKNMEEDDLVREVNLKALPIV